MTDIPLDSFSGKGYSYFATLDSFKTENGFRTDCHLGVAVYEPYGNGAVAQIKSVYKDDIKG